MVLTWLSWDHLHHLTKIAVAFILSANLLLNFFRTLVEVFFSWFAEDVSESKSASCEFPFHLSLWLSERLIVPLRFGLQLFACMTITRMFLHEVVLLHHSMYRAGWISLISIEVEHLLDIVDITCTSHWLTVWEALWTAFKGIILINEWSFLKGHFLILVVLVLLKLTVEIVSLPFLLSCHLWFWSVELLPEVKGPCILSLVKEWLLLRLLPRHPLIAVQFRSLLHWVVLSRLIYAIPSSNAWSEKVVRVHNSWRSILHVVLLKFCILDLSKLD